MSVVIGTVGEARGRRADGAGADRQRSRAGATDLHTVAAVTFRPPSTWQAANLPGGTGMSMAFLRDDAEGEMPRRNYGLPPREDPEYDRVAARALLEAARVSETQLAERATGYYWGEPKLRPHVEELLAEAERAGDDRLEQLARRFLR